MNGKFMAVFFRGVFCFCIFTIIKNLTINIKNILTNIISESILTLQTAEWNRYLCIGQEERNYERAEQ